METDGSKNLISNTNIMGLAHSPTQPNSLILPELHSASKIGGNFAFGLNNQKNLNYDEMSDIQRFDQSNLQSELGITATKQNKRLRGMQTAIKAGMFKASDIDRNSILSLAQDKKSKLGAYMSKKDLKVGVEEVNDDIKSLLPSA